MRKAGGDVRVSGWDIRRRWRKRWKWKGVIGEGRSGKEEMRRLGERDGRENGKIHGKEKGQQGI